MSRTPATISVEPQGWADRVVHARSSVQGARTLDELAAALNSPAFAALPLHDLVALPTFGGERPRGRCIFSWDATRVLVLNELCDGFEIVTRAP